LKKPADGKRARPPRRVGFAKSFSKDWERLERSGRFNMRLLKQAMLLIIANDEPLGPEWKGHPLKGGLAGFHECHIGGDFLLIYEVDDGAGPSGAVTFVRAGTHAELFRE
jgi:mRNA interferase YafQ